MNKTSKGFALLGAALIVCTFLAAGPAVAASTAPGSEPAVAQPAARSQNLKAPRADKVGLAAAAAAEQTSQPACGKVVNELFSPVPAMMRPQPNCVQYSTHQQCQDLCDCGPTCKKTCIQANCCCTCF